MLYFSPLSVTDDKQRDRKHPFSSPQCSQGNMGVGGWVGGWGGGGYVFGVVFGDRVDVVAWGIVPCVSKVDTLGLFHSLLKENFNYN